MIIPIDKKTRIFGTSRCWEIQRMRLSQGAEKWEPKQFYPKLGQALAAAGEREIRLAEGNGLADAIRAFTEVSQRYEKALDGALEEVSQRANELKRVAA